VIEIIPRPVDKTMSMRIESQTKTEKLPQRNWELSTLNTIAESLNKEVDLGRSESEGDTFFKRLVIIFLPGDFGVYN